MCRVFGIVYGPQGPAGERRSPAEIARVMFPALIAQGPHAWGWMENVDGEVSRHKYVGRCDTPQACRQMTVDDNAKWFIGHTRWATHGTPQDPRNNHPILHGNIMGVHNGGVRNYRQILDVTGREDENSVVDSEAIFAAVNRWGHEGVNRVDAAMVAVYADVTDPDTVRIVRSENKPLFYGFTPAGSLVFASEKQAIVKANLGVARFFELGKFESLTVRDGAIVERSTFKVHPSALSYVDLHEAEDRAALSQRDWIEREPVRPAGRFPVPTVSRRPAHYGPRTAPKDGFSTRGITDWLPQIIEADKQRKAADEQVDPARKARTDAIAAELDADDAEAYQAWLAEQTAPQRGSFVESLRSVREQQPSSDRPFLSKKARRLSDAKQRLARAQAEADAARAAQRKRNEERARQQRLDLYLEEVHSDKYGRDFEPAYARSRPF